jgi:hypothetical protein
MIYILTRIKVSLMVMSTYSILLFDKVTMFMMSKHLTNYQHENNSVCLHFPQTGNGLQYFKTQTINSSPYLIPGTLFSHKISENNEIHLLHYLRSLFSTHF